MYLLHLFLLYPTVKTHETGKKLRGSPVKDKEEIK